MIAVRRATEADRSLLWSLLQKYLYEMSAVFGLDMDAAGDYDYPWFDAYFREPDRVAWLILDDGAPAGFALVNAVSCMGEAIDRAMAEFTIVPRYRRRGFAMEAVKRVFAALPGRWEIKYSEDNPPARAFWTAVARPYAPRVTALGDGETALSFTVR